MSNEPVTLKVGQKAPDFSAQITNGDKIKIKFINEIWVQKAYIEHPRL